MDIGGYARDRSSSSSVKKAKMNDVLMCLVPTRTAIATQLLPYNAAVCEWAASVFQKTEGMEAEHAKLQNLIVRV